MNCNILTGGFEVPRSAKLGQQLEARHAPGFAWQHEARAMIELCATLVTTHRDDKHVLSPTCWRELSFLLEV